MAAVKEKSIEDKLKALYALQQVDSKLDRITILKGELPMEVRDLEDDILGLNTRISKLEAGIKKLDSEILEYNHKIKDSEGLIERYSRQLDNVKNNREFSALTKEIDLQNLDIQISKKRIAETEEEKKKEKEALDHIKVKLEQRSKDVENKKIELGKIIEKTEKEESKLTKESGKARKLLSDRLLASYDKIRGTYRNGLAVVKIERGACGGCFNRIPPQQQIEIGVMKRIIACEHCGRVLVDDTIAPEE